MRHDHLPRQAMDPAAHERQQFAAFSWERGVLDLPDEALAALAGRIGARVEQLRREG
jgi:hypothetical protein